MTVLIELPDGELLTYEEDTGYGYLLTRAPARQGPRSYDAVMADLERIERAWERDITAFLTDEADRIAARVQSSSRRLTKFIKPPKSVETRAAVKTGFTSTIVCLTASDLGPLREFINGDQEPHVTVLYVYDHPIKSESELTNVEDAVARYAATLKPITATITAVGALGDDDPPAYVAHLDAGDSVSRTREYLRSLITNTVDESPLPDKYPTFKMHVTLGYGLEDGYANETIGKTITFDRVELWTGGEHASVSNIERRVARMEIRRDSLGVVLARIFDKASFRRRMKARAEGLYGAVVDVALGDVEAAVGVGFDVKPSDRTRRMLAARANQLAGSVSDSIYKQIQRVLLRGIDEGDAVSDLAKRVKTVLHGAATSRATVIARTEVVSAYNGGVHEAGNDMPNDVVVGQMWVATQDSRTRPAHRTADGQIVARGDTFTVGGEELRYPGDPAGRPGNVIQCRCALRLLTPLDVEAGMTIPPPKRSAGPFMETRQFENILTRVAIGRLTCDEAIVEVRGEKAGHKFHGNQHVDGVKSGHGEHLTVEGDDIDRVLGEISRSSVNEQEVDEDGDTGKA